MRFPFSLSLFTLVVMAVSIFFNARHAQAQSGIELQDVSASVRFGEQITFSATIKSSIPIQNISIMISDESQNIMHVESLTMQTDGHTEFRFDTKQNILRPFSKVKWNYQFTFPDGSTTQSEPFFIRYSDERFDWQTLESDMLRVNWYQGDAKFGQAALDAARAGMASIHRLMTLELTQPIEIFIYAHPDDLRATLAQGKDEWVAGHVDPALGVVMVVIEPGADQGITLEQRIPHELMHVMQYRRVGLGYNNIPAWFREGTATLAEIYPNADYDRVLADAVSSDHLIPIRDLCTSFPADAGQAFLAYAESRSFMGYLHDHYGSTGLLDLAASYANGVDCERGTERAFGIPLSSLESNWHSSVLGQNPFFSTLQNISPYLVLLCLVLIIPLIGIASTLRKRGSLHESGTNVRK
jgi:hypothetical protein